MVSQTEDIFYGSQGMFTFSEVGEFTTTSCPKDVYKCNAYKNMYATAAHFNKIPIVALTFLIFRLNKET